MSKPGCQKEMWVWILCAKVLYMLVLDACIVL